MAGEPSLRVAVVLALPDEQAVVQLLMPAGSTVGEAIEQSGLLLRYPQFNDGRCGVGVFGKFADSATLLTDGDRVEIYRPLTVDPKDARRRRASLRASRQKPPRHGAS